MKTKLIIVEGLPGSGKSTTAQFVANQLKRNGIEANWYYEVGLTHPVDFAYEACLNEVEYDDLLKSYPDYKHILETEVKRTYGYYFYPYVLLDRKYKNQLPKTLIDTLETYDVTNKDYITYKTLKQTKWKDFGQTNQHEITVIESSFLQAPIVECLLKNESKSNIKTYIRQLKNCIENLNPTLIYYYQKDVTQSIQNMFTFRGQGFTDYVKTMIENSEYGKNNQLKGVNGAIQFFTEYRQIADEMFQEFEINKLGIDNTNQEWNRYQKQITDFLNLDLIQDVIVEDKTIFEGKFLNDSINKEWNLRVEQDILYVYFNETYKARLIPINQTSFQLEGNTVEINFIHNELGQVEHFMIGGRETAGSYGQLGLIFKKQ